ncbi:hypothetical protein DPMN_105927 [Dreissena polymorpha]|uniref:Uncharacterized protein n=1 Tax=Dreissena polymorpha TaxID=45954 RepID=A0A9D4QJ70_DREPO|nr:hypothetical protein DPMN_105927 [Dreissena polymorpha]
MCVSFKKIVARTDGGDYHRIPTFSPKNVEITTINSGIINVKEGAPGLVMGPCIVEIYRIVIRDVQDKFEVIHFRNEEVNVKAFLLRDSGRTPGVTGSKPAKCNVRDNIHASMKAL